MLYLFVFSIFNILCIFANIIKFNKNTIGIADNDVFVDFFGEYKILYDQIIPDDCNISDIKYFVIPYYPSIQNNLNYTAHNEDLLIKYTYDYSISKGSIIKIHSSNINICNNSNNTNICNNTNNTNICNNTNNSNVFYNVKLTKDIKVKLLHGMLEKRNININEEYLICNVLPCNMEIKYPNKPNETLGNNILICININKMCKFHIHCKNNIMSKNTDINIKNINDLNINNLNINDLNINNLNINNLNIDDIINDNVYFVDDDDYNDMSFYVRERVKDENKTDIPMKYSHFINDIVLRDNVYPSFLKEYNSDFIFINRLFFKKLDHFKFINKNNINEIDINDINNANTNIIYNTNNTNNDNFIYKTHIDLKTSNNKTYFIFLEEFEGETIEEEETVKEKSKKSKKVIIIIMSIVSFILLCIIICVYFYSKRIDNN
ncbi:hypothetical protein EHP00_1745 [Ecytonucleospora hepatopenaei]|uniref:6-cysteine protein n=1 Tax=Ecytonucleospora hepatopenaei TaxID=646526 RepID=A0A1W0E700_9MICR|nr:hypothetical protein EHP00_1745 [Ecytonucleospora hepatopenaei]